MDADGGDDDAASEVSDVSDEPEEEEPDDAEVGHSGYCSPRHRMQFN